MEPGGDLSPTLWASSGGGDEDHVLLQSCEAHFGYTAAAREDGSPDWSNWRVRWLMPLECERWTAR